MSDKEYKFKIDRRSFLSRSACASMGIGSLVNTIAQLRLMQNAAMANTNPAYNAPNYKALVCIFMRGGWDTNNVLIPRLNETLGNGAHYANYRGVVQVPNGVAEPTYNPGGADNTIPIAPANKNADEYGLNPDCVNMAGLHDLGRLAFVANCGTLAFPMDNTNYNTDPRPIQLFSHNSQVSEWMSSVADQPFLSGWGGRVADLVHGTENPHSSTSMLITAAGNNDYMIAPAGSVPQYTVTTTGAVSLAGYGTNYASAINAATGHYNTNSTGRRLQAFENIMRYSHDHILEEGYNTVVRRARESEELVGLALAEATASGVDFDDIFDVQFDPRAVDNQVSLNLHNELKMIARLIAGRRCLGNNRQIFFCDLGGFDNHNNINVNLPRLLKAIDAGLGAFNKAMVDLQVADGDFTDDQVTVFEASDFNRTFTPNGNIANASGTDHAWGTHAFVMGGAVKAQHAGASNLYGFFPNLQPGLANPNDVPSGNRGRWIPTSAVDQYAAVLSSWLGVDSTGLQTILPNLGRFQEPILDPGNVANLKFLSL